MKVTEVWCEKSDFMPFWADSPKKDMVKKYGYLLICYLVCDWFQPGMTNAQKGSFWVFVCLFVLVFNRFTYIDCHSDPCFVLSISCSWSTRRGENGCKTPDLGSDLLLKSPQPSSSSLSTSNEPCLRQGAASYLALFVIILATLNLITPRIQRSLTPLHKPSMLPRLRLKMATLSQQLSKQWACRGMYIWSIYIKITVKQWDLAVRCVLFSTLSRCPAQWCGNVSDLPWGSWWGDAALTLRLHWYAGKSAQELLGEVAVILQHQLLWTLSHGVHYWAATTTTHTG